MSMRTYVTLQSIMCVLDAHTTPLKTNMNSSGYHRYSLRSRVFLGASHVPYILMSVEVKIISDNVQLKSIFRYLHSTRSHQCSFRQRTYRVASFLLLKSDRSPSIKSF